MLIHGWGTRWRGPLPVPVDRTAGLRFVGELRVAMELFVEDPEADLDEPLFSVSHDGEGRSGILGFGSCQSVKNKNKNLQKK